MAQHRPPDNLALLPWPCGHITEREGRPAGRQRTCHRPYPPGSKGCQVGSRPHAASEGRGEGTELRDAADEGPSSGARLGREIAGWWLGSSADVPAGNRHRDGVEPSSCVAHGWSGDCMGPAHRTSSVKEASGSTVRQ